MAFDFSKIIAKKKEEVIVDPIELFQKLKVTDPTINDLWLAQGDALRQWHENRSKPDIGIVLNTGAGKTLVGLLVAQSLVNETRGKVLYACSSIQLIEQTAEKAEGYGLGVTTYFRGQYNNDLYARSECPCITTYQALFNGRSIFFREEIAAVVFDDAHTAEHLIRDQFSLHIEKTAFSDAYKQIIGLFKEYHQEVGWEASYEELSDAACHRLFFVPPFEVRRQFSELLRILKGANLSDNDDTTFAWEHIKDRVDLCCLFITASGISITPPFVPVTTLKYFHDRVRRVYLSATLSASDGFARTFGRIPRFVVPATTAGECERLVLIPSKARMTDKDTDIAKILIEGQKALILVPTYARAAIWEEVATPPPKDRVSEYVRTFKSSSGSQKLLLTARYDGIDLPGDTCRVMVIDDCPTGVGPLERYFWEYVGLFNGLSTTIASRVVQSFGRISRGMSDHGVVILTGEKLIEWLLSPRNRALLPPFLQKQIALGIEVSSNTESADDFASAMKQCLNRNKGWLETYDAFMKTQGWEAAQLDGNLLAELATSEAEYAYYIWHRKYEKAAKCFRRTLDQAFNFSAGTGAWHSLWLGYVLELMSDRATARELYSRAHACNVNMPAYWSPDQVKPSQNISPQVTEVVRQFLTDNGAKVRSPKRLHQDLSHLGGPASPPQVEESLRSLGQYLGMDSSRPDKEHGTGPDVLWETHGLPSLCIEVKTDKDLQSIYQKKEIGQLSDHVQWVKDNTYAGEILPIFVGPLCKVSEVANPPPEFRVVALEEFHKLADRLEAALKDICTNALPLSLTQTISEVFKERNLLWPDCFHSLDSHCLSDL